MAKPAVSAVTNASENEIASVEQLIARARNALIRRGSMKRLPR
jgi:hypothetical protein